MAAAGKTEYGLKIFKIVNYRCEASPTILDYKKIDNPDEKKVFNEELSLLLLKYKLLKIKLNERVPAYSRCEEHIWYITKDKFGIIYMILTMESFEEKYVFKLQNRVRTMIEYYYDDLNSGDEKKSNEIRLKIEEKVDQMNNALSKADKADVLISSDNSEYKRKSQDDIIINLEIPLNQFEESVDLNNFFYLLDLRNNKVFIIQIVVLSSMFLTLILGVVDVLFLVRSN